MRKIVLDLESSHLLGEEKGLLGFHVFDGDLSPGQRNVFASLEEGQTATVKGYDEDFTINRINRKTLEDDTCEIHLLLKRND